MGTQTMVKYIQFLAIETNVDITNDYNCHSLGQNSKHLLN